MEELDFEAAFGEYQAAARFFSGEITQIRQALAVAQDEAAMPAIGVNIRKLVHQALDLAPAEVLTRLISTLNDALTCRVIELACARFQIDSSDWCWIALGSEGRKEQTFSSDQDNGIIFAEGCNADAQRARFLPLALHINHVLADCGFTLCRGNIMASNPECCLGLHEWRGRFADWIFESDAQALLNASIFFDFRPLYGKHEPASLLAEWLAANSRDNPGFLLRMAANALRRGVPLGFLHNIVVDRHGDFAGTIDLKLQAATLFVDAARVLGLACGSFARNTADRLRHAAAARLIEQDEAESWIGAFYFIERLRLKCQHASELRGESMHNHIDPVALDESERHALLDALGQAKALQKRLAQSYPGSA
ncbi:CBS domain-containing protein [Paucimonas lemoignei]|uniref:CBS domain-containing protein n=1 Tax=Paucimonas lemoignei TaxID=29443 RepID=A0A4R3I451_PAULE|nr:DUF294 nucleotidyltransferase-like domain-containing protein [Paucimonas lemoignei]TCS39641.1 CBS domain-containing protein [Paucimonas lemoignei]